MAEAEPGRIPLVESGKVSLGRLAFTGTVWTTIGHFSDQALRMLTQVIIANLLWPEAIGLIMLVTIWIHGIRLFTDIGLGPSIIQHARGSEDSFLRTAWTIQILRGFVIFTFVLLMAWPLSHVYGQQALLVLLPFAATEALMNGLTTTAVFLANRRVQMARLTLVDIASNIVGSVVAINWAYWYPSVWAYVAMPVSRTAFRFVASHMAFPVPRMGLEFDRAAFSSIWRFGKWIFVSSILGFLSSSLDRLLLGKVLAGAEFGIYATAFLWARSPINALYTISAKVLFPIYAHLADREPKALANRILRLRLMLLLPTLPVLYGFTLFGEEFIGLIYKDAYADAGWILKVLAAGAAIPAVVATSSSVLLAVGDSFRFMIMLATGTVSVAFAMAVGFLLFDFEGLIVGVAFSEVLNYPIVARFTHRYGAWQPKLDFTLFGITAVVTYIAFGVL